jgi:hypothetical protein
MNRMEKAVLLCALIAQVVVIALGIHHLGSEPPGPSSAPRWLPALTVLLSLAAVVLIFRDLYEREFPNPNSKLTWMLIMVLTGGIGMVVYALRHAVRPRRAQ